MGLVIFISRGWFVKTEKQPNVEGFYKLTNEDPLFYSPFFDGDNFEKAINDLEEEDKGFRNTIVKNIEATTTPQSNHYISTFKENSLFPFKFLKNLSPVNQETKIFLENPSIEQGQKLLKIYDKAADAYIQEVSSKVNLFEKIANIGKQENGYGYDQYFYFVDSVTSFERVKDDYLVIQENGYKLKNEIERRRNCLLGKESCQLLFKTKDNSAFINLMGAEFNLKGENVDFIKSLLPNYSIYPSEATGPYKIESSCWQNSGSENWLYLIYTKNNGKNWAVPKLANQNYYYKVEEQVKNPIYQALLKKGLDFCDQMETTYYECMDLTYYPQLLTLDFLKKQMEAGKISKGNLEKELDYKLLIENQFGLITPAINFISEVLNSRKNIQIILRNQLINPASVFSMETSYSIFYFPFAKSIWRIDKQPQYTVPRTDILNVPPQFITLDEVEKLGYSKGEIKKFQVNFVDFIASLVEKN